MEESPNIKILKRNILTDVVAWYTWERKSVRERWDFTWKREYFMSVWGWRMQERERQWKHVEISPDANNCRCGSWASILQARASHSERYRHARAQALMRAYKKFGKVSSTLFAQLLDYFLPMILGQWILKQFVSVFGYVQKIALIINRI